VSIPITPLDAWIARRLEDGTPGVGYSAETLRPVDRKTLAAAQERALRVLVRHAAANAPFYRERLRGLEDAPLRELPFTFPSDLAGAESRFLTVSQSEIRRVVTLATSGTTAPPKRLCFTDEDLEATEEFFLHGMVTFTPPGSAVAVLMGGTRPDGIGALLKRGLRRLGCSVHVFPLGEPPAATAARLDEVRPSVVVGLPAQVAAAAELSHHAPRVALLSGDMAPPSLRRRIEARWGCRVFVHYGLTESGWGCAVECAAREGCHVRELDLLPEIVDENGNVLPQGEWGEVTLTTLTRRSFPLLRYRSGDEGRFLPECCSCGSVLRRVEVRGRLPRRGAGGHLLRLYDAEEVLWRLPQVRDFALSLSGGKDRHETLLLELVVSGEDGDIAAKAVHALRALPGIPPHIVVTQHFGPVPERPGPKRSWGDACVLTEDRSGRRIPPSPSPHPRGGRS
jgi:phenylacetate-coenzyme A ligase PaaK-like adenylate-forming protein